MVASPRPIPFDLSRLRELRAVLVETYESATIPTKGSHPFQELLRACGQYKIPLFFSSHYGIDVTHHYKAPELDELGVSVYRISNLIPETALPLLILSYEGVTARYGELTGEELGEKICSDMVRRARGAPASADQLLHGTEIVRLRQ